MNEEAQSNAHNSDNLAAKIENVSNGNVLTRSKPFKALVDRVFKACDTSKTGYVSKTELYVGLLSVHITLARYAGPAACFVSTPNLF